MIRLRDIFTRFAPDYLKRYGHAMPRGHLRALRDISVCRTDRMGVHVEQCDDCGDRRLVPHSCRNRLCPSCHNAEIQDWIATRAADVLPAPYFHLTFPLPSEYRMLIRANQKALGQAAMQAAAESLAVLAQDRLGGKAGMMIAFHTWGRSLPWHPHVHCLVPGLVVHPDNTIRVLNPKFLVPVCALSRIYRAVFLRKARAALPGVRMPEPPGKRSWVVHCRPCREGPQNVIRYLARYARRGPLHESSIISADDQAVVFRYRDHRTQKLKTCTLSPCDFMARYLQHAPPKGFHRVRYYGILAPGARRTLRAAQLQFMQRLLIIAAHLAQLREPCENRPPHRCPQCGGTHFTRFGFRGPARPLCRSP